MGISGIEEGSIFGNGENEYLAFSKILVLFSEIENGNTIFLWSLFCLEMKTGNEESK